MANGEQPLAVRVNSLDLTRCTEQCAILMSLLVGQGEMRQRSPVSATAPQPPRGPRQHGPAAVRRKVARRAAVASVMGYLHRSYCNGRIVHIYPNHHDISKIWGHAVADVGRYAGRPEASLDLDLAAAPVDGIRALLKGAEGGSISVLTGGPSGSFVSPEAMAAPNQKEPEWFFVLATRAKVAVPPVVAEGASRPVPLPQVIQKADFIDQALRQTGKNPAERVIGTLEVDHPRALRRALRSYARLRTLQGSSVASAMTAYFPALGLDAYADTASRTGVVIMASAARATGGELYAFPIAKAPGRRLAFSVAPNTPVRRSDFYVPGKDVFVTATGITENLILRGVRFLSQGRVSTHTLCLRSGTGSCRFISQEHDLERKTFRVLHASRKHDAGGYDAEAYEEMSYSQVPKYLA